MIESPVLQRVIAESLHQVALEVLKDRFDTVPRNVTKPLREILAVEQRYKGFFLSRAGR